jgi:hypothetical protein
MGLLAVRSYISVSMLLGPIVTVVYGAILVATVACVAPTPTPTATSSPTPNPDVEATVVAAIRAIATAGPRPTHPPTPTPTPTPRVASSQALSLVEQLSPTLADLPVGYQIARQGRIVSNSQLVELSTIPEELRADLNEFGRVTGFQVTYIKGTTTLTTSVHLYETEDGASASFSLNRLATESLPEVAAHFGVPSEFFQFHRVQPSIQTIGQGKTVARLAVNRRFTPIWFGCLLEQKVAACVFVWVGQAETTDREVLREIEMVLATLSRKVNRLASSDPFPLKK